MRRLSFSSVPLAASLILPVSLTLLLALSACATTPGAGPTAAPQAVQGAGPTAVPAAPKAETTALASQNPETNAGKPAAAAPKYGGKLNFVAATDPSTWDDDTTPGFDLWGVLLAQKLVTGDWTKGPAGGFGTNETDWASFNYEVFGNNTGELAESWKIDIDNQKQQATVVFKIRPGVRWALNPNSEASKLVGGREFTADDAVGIIKWITSDNRAYLYRANPELRNMDASKTGPQEITLKLPIASLATALAGLDNTRLYPPELIGKLADWKNQVGTGPFMLTDYVSGSSVTYARNPNYWGKDPIGPGKGNQLPYLDGIQFFIIPDASTQVAAFRTAKIDYFGGVGWEDANQLKKEFPQMPNALGMPRGPAGTGAMYMRTDKPPFNDIRVRRALFMATDFNAIKQTMNGGFGNIITFPFDYYKIYADLYVGIDDPDLPAAIKELFTYSPDKAKQLLAQAGFPNGFKTSVMVTSAGSTYYEAISSMWAKAGVNLAIDIKDNAALLKTLDSQAWDGLAFNTPPPVSKYYSFSAFNGVPSSGSNTSFVDDAHVKEVLPDLRVLAVTNEKEAMKQGRELAKYALDQAWAIPVPTYRATTFWWPWLKNYSGEISAGYHNNANWTQFVWLDQDLKKSMGH